MDTYKTKFTLFMKLVMAAAVAGFAAAATVQAEEYSLHFLDPVGDNYQPYFDITGLDFTFDPQTGAYHGRFYTSQDSPFSLSSGSHWFNLAFSNLQRQEAGLEFASLRYTARGTLLSGTILAFEGSDPALTTWLPGQHIRPAQSDFPATSGIFPTLYTPWTSPGDFLGAALIVMDPMLIDQIAVIQVPEPSAFWLTGMGLGAFAICRKFRFLFALGRSGLKSEVSTAMPFQDSSNFTGANCSPLPASQREAIMVAVGFSPRNTRRAESSRNQNPRAESPSCDSLGWRAAGSEAQVMDSLKSSQP